MQTRQLLRTSRILQGAKRSKTQNRTWQDMPGRRLLTCGSLVMLTCVGQLLWWGGKAGPPGLREVATDTDDLPPPRATRLSRPAAVPGQPETGTQQQTGQGHATAPSGSADILQVPPTDPQQVAAMQTATSDLDYWPRPPQLNRPPRTTTFVAARGLAWCWCGLWL